MPTNSIRSFRREQHAMRQGYESKPPFRPFLTVQREQVISPSDMERMEAIPVHAYNADGTFLTLPGYDDPAT